MDTRFEIMKLKSEIAFLQGKIDVYERFLKMKGYIKEENKSDKKLI